jgi:hypothetical protein
MKLPNLVFLFLVLAAAVSAQRRVDPRHTYHRILVVVPYAGSGTAADPVRPKYAPAVFAAAPLRTDIIGYVQVISDDGAHSIVEFVARDIAAFAPILGDTSLQVFEKGKDTKEAIETALKKFKKDFSLDSFGVVMP